MPTKAKDPAELQNDLIQLCLSADEPSAADAQRASHAASVAFQEASSELEALKRERRAALLTAPAPTILALDEAIQIQEIEVERGEAIMDRLRHVRGEAEARARQAKAAERLEALPGLVEKAHGARQAAGFAVAAVQAAAAAATEDGGQLPDDLRGQVETILEGPTRTMMRPK